MIPTKNNNNKNTCMCVSIITIRPCRTISPFAPFLDRPLHSSDVDFKKGRGVGRTFSRGGGGRFRCCFSKRFFLHRSLPQHFI